jgi:hypothetical protein
LRAAHRFIDRGFERIERARLVGLALIGIAVAGWQLWRR